MNLMGYIIIGGLVIAVLGGCWHAWKHRNDDWDMGGPYL